MITVAEHTYEETLLPEKANVLDLGCRGFLFTNHLRHQGHNVVAVDLDEIEGDYLQLAVVANGSAPSLIPYERHKDPQATKISLGKLTGLWAESTTVEELRKYAYPSMVFDLIKIDIEGSEYEVIMSLTEPPARQLSIEFHLHTKIYGEAQVKEMEDKLVSLGYYPAKHDKTSEHGCGMNYWDSLWILK